MTCSLQGMESVLGNALVVPDSNASGAKAGSSKATNTKTSSGWMTARRRSTVIIGVAAIAIAGVTVWVVRRNQNAVQYRTATAEKSDINVTVSATGNPNPVVTVQVGSQVSGIIIALNADFNTKVTKGQLVARIDPAPFQARVDQAHAYVDTAKAAVVNAEAGVQKAQAAIEAANATLASGKANVVKAQAAAQDAKLKADRRVQLAKEGIIDKEDVETAQTTSQSASADQAAMIAQQAAAAGNVGVAQADLKVAQTQLAENQAQVKQFSAALQSAQLDLDHTLIQAPVDGVVVSRNVDVGQTVAASLAAPTLFLIAQDMTKMQVDTNVSEADVGRVRVGQPATFTVDAYPGRIFNGAVTSIRQAAINVSNVITYDAVVGVSNADLKLFPGMTANVKILVDQRKNALTVPNAALRYHPASATPAVTKSAGRKVAAIEQAVWVLDAHNKPERVAVTTGVSDGTYTEVMSGALKDGDRLIVAAVAKAGSTPATPTPQGRGPGF